MNTHPDGYFDGIRDVLLVDDGHVLLVDDRVGLGHVNGVRPVDEHLDWHLDRVRHGLLVDDWVGMEHGHMLGDGHGLDVPVMDVLVASQVTEPAETAKVTAQAT